MSALKAYAGLLRLHHYIKNILIFIPLFFSVDFFNARALAERIVVEGQADGQGYIGEFIDITTESVNETLTPGGQFSIARYKLKIAGDDPEAGVYFVPETDPAASPEYHTRYGTRMNGVLKTFYMENSR